MASTQAVTTRKIEFRTDLLEMDELSYKFKIVGIYEINSGKQWYKTHQMPIFQSKNIAALLLEAYLYEARIISFKCRKGWDGDGETFRKDYVFQDLIKKTKL